MLEFTDEPYRFFPPRRFGPTAWLLTLVNRYIRLPYVKRIQRVEVSGHESLRGRYRAGDRLLFVPNHPTHADPAIYTEAISRTGVRTRLMAAYDVMLRRRLNAWAMQRMGAFSVDREGSDPRSMKAAMETLTAGRYALTIFPEGNVYLQNDAVTPFHDGAAMLALRSARALADGGGRVFAVPVSIKATYVEDVRKRVDAALGELAIAVEAPEQAGDSPLQRLRRVGVEALHRNMRHRGISFDEADDLGTLIRSAADAVLSQLEAKMELQLRPADSVIDRVRKARRAIHQIRIDPGRAVDHPAATTWADQAMVAFRIASYDGHYVASRPTLDRFAETVEKMKEDIYAKAPEPFGPRCAYVRFGEPIDTADYLDSFAAKARIAVRSLTGAIEQAVQQGLDDLNRANTHPGAALVQEPAGDHPDGQAESPAR